MNSTNKILAHATALGILHFGVGYIAQQSGMNYSPSAIKTLFVMTIFVGYELYKNKKTPTK